MAYTTINKSSAYFNTKLYTGTGSSNAITGVGHAPNWTWIKNRATTDMHSLFDAVRGATKRISTSNNSAQATEAQDLKAFGSDGFTVGTSGAVNSSNVNYVSWNWKANGQGSSNTAGSINTTYTSADTTSKFSIVTYTGTGANATVGHGLGAVPKMIIVKRLDNGANWRIYHASLGATKNLLFATDTIQTTSTMWNNTAPTSSVFYLGSYNEVNGSSAPHVAYCFGKVKGFSDFGSYTGNGNANGPFIYTGFKPAWILIKRYNAAGSWRLVDNKRIGYNRNNYYLTPNTGGGDGTGSTLAIDMFSNGFKVIGTDIDLNTSGGQYIYMAFAEAPLVGTNNIPATAR